ncbi:MAG TPA: ATPase, T2SS/T4P/T4SS family [archaeon]|nr:ATPase, T2SS/T4P/T4SS family [archaeon]
MVFESEYDPESQRVRINCMGSIYGPSIEDYDVVMSVAIDKLLEIKRLVRIVFVERREHEYDFNESRMLLEIANAIEKIIRDRIITIRNMVNPDCEYESQERYDFLTKTFSQIKYDPIEAYKWLVRETRHANMAIEKEQDETKRKCAEHYLSAALVPMSAALESCRMIQLVRNRLHEHRNRSLYRQIFHPSIRPNFMYTRYVATPPANAELLERYSLGETDIQIYNIPGKVRRLYHFIPPEFKLEENEYAILDKARQYIGRHEPRDIELTEPETVRDNLKRISADLLRDMSRNEKIPVMEESLDRLADILVRYTAGLGVLELLLQDEGVQDIAVNSPIGSSPIYIVHGTYGECETNMVPSMEDAETWATRFRLHSGRPLDEANSVLDTEIELPQARARVTAITRSLSPEGLGFAFRRHRLKPWTFPLFISTKMLDSFSAGLIWFLVDGARTLLVGGTRGSGKTSLLGAIMVQIMPKIRIITLEDTLELPIEQLRELGYNIERLKSRSVITQVETEMPAEEGLRAALRLGDSSLIIGEVRSGEAKALYEAMRIGALANTVAGTIHGDSAYGVFDRVVNDLGVPPTSFKATDFVLIANALRSPDGLSSFRRLTELTEVRKHWKADPQEEGGFIKLLEYSAKDDTLKPTETLALGESTILNEIASRTREWKGRWDLVWENILLRGNVLQHLTDFALKNKRPDAMEAEFVIKSNSMFHIISREVLEETGSMDSAVIFQRWKAWLESGK